MTNNSLHDLLVSVCINQVGDKDDIMVFVGGYLFDPYGSGGWEQKSVRLPLCSRQKGRTKVRGANKLNLVKSTPDFSRQVSPQETLTMAKTIECRETLS